MKTIIKTGFAAFMLLLAISCKKDSTIPVTPAPPPLITDLDGNIYDTVRIGSQVWLKVNLRTTHYRNGDPIPNITDPSDWFALTTGAWCWYNNDSATYAATYGKLYNWFAVNDPRGLSPKGLHVPSDAEWTTLTRYLGGEDVAGGKIKEASGFSGLPGGYRNYGGTFNYIGYEGFWWSSTENGTNSAWFRFLCGQIYRNGFCKRYGFSIRCLRD